MIYNIYTIKNIDNGRIFIGRSVNENQYENHMQLLKDNNHFNKLLQKDYNDKCEFKFEYDIGFNNPTMAAEYAIEQIEKQNTINPLYGYNTFFDGEGMNSRTANLKIFDEDLIMFFYNHDKNKIETLKNFNINNNVFKYRMKRNGLLPQYNIPISSYNALYAYATLTVALSDHPMTASQVQYVLFANFDISKRLRITSHKISKNLKKQGIPSQKKSNFLYYNLDFSKQTQ